MSHDRLHSQTVFDSVLTGSTRSGRLMQETGASVTGKPAVLLVPALTANAPCRSLITARRLAPILRDQDRALFTVQWQHHWTSTGNERFSPLVRDLRILLQNDVFGDRPVHLAAAGSGALIALKLLRSSQPNPTPLASLSLLAPSLRVQNRSPRTPLVNLPKNCCVVADEACGVTPWQDTVTLARRLPVVPRFLLAQACDSYWTSQNDATLKPDLFLQNATQMAGAWDTAWADWLQQTDVANAASDSHQISG